MQTSDNTGDDDIREYYSDQDEAKNNDNSDLVRRSEISPSDSRKSGKHTKGAESFFASKKADKKPDKK